MEFMLHMDLKKIPEPIEYGNKVMLMGSCFTEHIGKAMAELKFDVLQNPNGILFGPDAVCKSLLSYVANQQYTDEELFYLNDVWNSWDHHSRFSNINRAEAIREINNSQQTAHEFLNVADWLIITLGSSSVYNLTARAEVSGLFDVAGRKVANCHRAPADWFSKELLKIETITAMLDNCLKQLHTLNPGLKFIFTVSPVRHIRDTLVENNRSKARLIEAVHAIVSKFETAFYFPAYELVIDVLRDYRFYDIDLVHPNYQATEFVLEKFEECCISEKSQQVMKEVKKMVLARKHRPFQPATEAHQQFLRDNLQKTRQMQQRYPFLDFSSESEYFSESGS